jgi:hypothetical protein
MISALAGIERVFAAATPFVWIVQRWLAADLTTYAGVDPSADIHDTTICSLTPP